MPELIQDAATPEAMAAAVLAWLEDSEARRHTEERFLQLHLSLRQNTAERAASVIEGLLKARGRHG